MSKANSPALHGLAGLTGSEIRQRYTSLSKSGRKYMPYLQIDHQSFPICVEYTTKKRAEWFRDQLAIALRRMISQNAQAEPSVEKMS